MFIRRELLDLSIKVSGSERGAKTHTSINGKFECLGWRMLRNALEAGDAFVRDSNEFRRFEDDLISDMRWEDKRAVLRDIGAPLLLTPIEDTLAAFRDSSERKFDSVNQRIGSGANKHIKVRGSKEERRWTLVYPSEEEPVNSPFYSQLPGISIADLLSFVTLSVKRRTATTTLSRQRAWHSRVHRRPLTGSTAGITPVVEMRVE